MTGEQNWRLSCCLTFDFDAMSLWIGSLQSNNPSMISRGEFGAVVSVPRILDLLDLGFADTQTLRQLPLAQAVGDPQGYERAAYGPNVVGDRKLSPAHPLVPLDLFLGEPGLDECSPLRFYDLPVPFEAGESSVGEPTSEGKARSS